MKRIKVVPPKGLNERQKRFAELVASGAAQGHAYVAAGYSPKGADQHGSRLARNEKVKAYIQDLSEKASQNRALSLQETLDFLSDIVRTPIGEIDQNSHLCQEMRVTKDGMVIKMPSKIEAAKLASILRGDIKREGGPVNVSVVNVQERTKQEDEAFVKQFNRVVKPAVNGSN